jgi:putative addiction module component (TIGR02574 family)
MSSVDSLFSQVMALSPLERERFVAQIVTALDSPQDNCTSNWAQELHERVERHDRGETEAIDIEVAMEIARRRLSERQ